jgi:ATP-dependent Clp protease protease subunit
MNLKYFKNTADKNYEIIISGDIGWDVSGKGIADEIRHLNSIGAKRITLRINSPGGMVLDGYDVIDAIINSATVIETIVTGLAASTAGWLAAAGTKGYRTIVDYGKGMIHDPSFGENNIEDLPEGPQREGLIQIKDSISTILTNHSNLNKKTIDELMSKETWISAKLWVDYGFADKVITTSDKPALKENYSMLEFMNACNDIKKTQLKEEIKMKSVLNFLKLSDDAQENSALEAVKNISQKAENALVEVDTLTNKITEMENKVTEKDAEINNLKSQVAVFENKEKDAAVDSAIKSGKFSEDNRAGLTEQVKLMGVENFNKMVEMAALPTANAIAEINNGGEPTGEKKPTGEQKLAAEYKDLATNNPEELKKIQNSEPARFEKMLEAFNNN